MAANENGDLFVAFVYLPILRKYPLSGKLLAEYKIETPVLKVKEEFNLKAIGEGIRNSGQRVSWKPLLIAIKIMENRIFLLTHCPRLEILELNEGGALECVHWKEFDEVFEVNDFAVADIGGETRIFVARSKPPMFDIYVFAISNGPGENQQ